MATARLIPSTYYLSNEQYLAVENADNMYANTDSTTYGTVTHNRASTNSTYYVYIRGFNFDDIPSAAVVSAFTVKIKASATGHTTSTSSSYYMSLYNGTTAIGSTSASGRLSTTLTTFTFSNGSLTWDTIVGYGSNFGIRIPLRRASSNTADVVSVYGAEIEVTYTVPDPRTITTTLTGSGTISPSGATTAYDGDSFTLTITPTTKTDTVTATKGGTDITNDLVVHYETGTSTSTSAVLGTYSLISGGFNGSGATYFQGIVGNGHTAATTTSNYYSSGSGTTAVFQYAISFNGVPSNAVVTRLYMMASGHAESTSNSSEYMCVQLKSGSTELSEQYNFKNSGSTSNSTQTIEATTLPTVEQLSSLVVECTLGYYGGAINGVTVYLEYAIPTSTIDYYTYTYTVSGNATIAVVIGSSPTPSDVIWFKSDGEQTLVSSVYCSDEDSPFVSAVDLTSLTVGDTCSVTGGLYIVDGGTQTHQADIGQSFTWTGSTYTYTVDVYTVSISSSSFQVSKSASGTALYASGDRYIRFYKGGGGWVAATKVYKKVNGSWVEQSDLTTVFDSTKNYVKG